MTSVVKVEKVTEVCENRVLRVCYFCLPRKEVGGYSTTLPDSTNRFLEEISPSKKIVFEKMHRQTLNAVRVLTVRQIFQQNSVQTQIFARSYSNNIQDINENVALRKYQPIADFYNGKSIFITGGTGFLGKALIEKLLYATNLDKIYVLIRDKKGVDVNTRLENMFENPLFSRLKDSKPSSFDKVVPVRGDIELPNLGISQQDEKTLIEKVSVVFHSAATIMLHQPLPVTMNTNFEGTKRILNLTKRMRNIEAFVHTSTAYCHPNRPVLHERIYPAPATLDDVHHFIKVYGDNPKETKKFVEGSFTTYGFSKAMTEAYIADNHGDVPTAIVRPSSVSPTASEPLIGWTDNWFASTSTFHNCGKGWTLITLGDENHLADSIPVDYVTNLTMIVAARLNRSKKIQVYNCTSSSENPLTWGEAYKCFIDTSEKQGYNEVPRFFHLYSKSEMVVNLLTIILQIIPAHIADVWLRIKGKNPKYVKLMRSVLIMRNSVLDYTSRSWVFRADKSVKLYSELSPEDQKSFPCNPADINWPKYLKDYCNGIFKYLKPKFTARDQ